MKTKSLALLLLLTCPATAEVPDTFKNLQVLPKDISKQRLVETMRQFSFATGYRCEGCHEGKDGQREAMEYAADGKQTKRTARLMLKMVQSINADHLATLGGSVSCATCHR